MLFLPGRCWRRCLCPPDLHYDAVSRTLKWDGQLLPGQILTYVWETRVLTDIAVPAYPTVTLSMADWGLDLNGSPGSTGRDPNL